MYSRVSTKIIVNIVREVNFNMKYALTVRKHIIIFSDCNLSTDKLREKLNSKEKNVEERRKRKKIYNTQENKMKYRISMPFLYNLKEEDVVFIFSSLGDFREIRITFGEDERERERAVSSC